MMIPVTIDFDGVKGESAFSADLSDGGMCLWTQSRLEVGQSVRVVMSLPSRQLVGMGVVLRQCDAPRMPSFGSCAYAIRLEGPMSELKH